MLAVSKELWLPAASLISSTGSRVRNGPSRLRARLRVFSFRRSAVYQFSSNSTTVWAYINSFLATVPLTATKNVLASLKPLPFYADMHLSRTNTFSLNVPFLSGTTLYPFVALDSLPSIVSWPPPFSSFSLHVSLECSGKLCS